MTKRGGVFCFDKGGRYGKKKKIVFLGLIVVTLVVGFYFTPHFAIYNFKKAADNKDSVALSDYVDYPSLRESLKANINAKMAKEVFKEKESNPFQVLGAALATLFIDRMIEVFITPESIAIMMNGEKPRLEKPESVQNSKTSSEESNIETLRSYENFNRFVVKIKKKDSPEGPIELVFKRDGIISWKLCALRLQL